MKAQTYRRRERGVAFIMVLAILLALSVLAVPMLMNARNDSALSKGQIARSETRLRAETTLAYARERLRRGHRAVESLRASGALPLNEPGRAPSTPDVDTPDESVVPIALEDSKGRPLVDIDGVPFLHFRDPRGVLTHLEVRDESSLPNLYSAGPFLIASVLGRSTLGDEIDDQDAELVVEDGTGFPLQNGRLLVGGELVSYDVRDGNRFFGCRRGLLGGLKASQHKEDEWVLDERARQIAMLPFRSPRAAGGYREPIAPTAVKEIALLGEVSLTANEVDRLLRSFTTLGQRFSAGLFGPESTVTAILDPANDDGNGFQIPVNDHEPFNFGTVLRLTDRVNTEYLMVAESRPGRIRVFEGPRNVYQPDRTFVAPLLRHPVNMNAADKDTLVRIMNGIQGRFGPGGAGAGTLGRMDADGAEDVADAILAQRPVRDLRHFRRLLEEVSKAHPIDFNQILAIFTFANAVRPSHSEMITSTVPFSFASTDSYTIAATAVRNDGSGRELARHIVRERVHVAPSGAIAISLTNQRAFEESIYRARQGRWVATHPWPTARIGFLEAVQPYDRIGRMLFQMGGLTGAEERPAGDQEDVERSGQEGVWGHAEVGDVRLLPARLVGASAHFDGPALFQGDSVPLDRIDPEGFVLDRGPFDIPNGGAGGRGFGRQGPGQQGGGSLFGRRGAEPVRVDFWINLGSNVGVRQVLYDAVGNDPDEDRIQLVLEGDGTLRARVFDRTLDRGGDGLEEVAETRWLPLSAGFWRPDTAYHVGIAYRGSRPSDVQLFVDGFLRGSARYQTRLNRGIDEDATAFDVEDADGWPDRGVALVGGQEAIAFDRNGNSFDVVTLNGTAWGRGQRGTKAARHVTGASVTILGYSLLPVGTTTHARSNRPVLTRGGAKLASSLGPFTAAWFTPNKREPDPSGGQNPIRVDLHDPGEPKGGELELLPPGQIYDAFPETGGYVLIVSRTVGHVPGVNEIAYFSSRVGNRLLGLQDASDLTNPLLLAAAAGAPGNAGFRLTRQRHPVFLVGDPMMRPHVAVIPISVGVTGFQGLRQPEQVQTGPGGAAATFNTWPEMVQVGIPDVRNLDSNDVEWIRYHHISSRGDLVMDEPAILSPTAAALRAVLPSFVHPQAAALLSAVFPFRSQGGTGDLLNDPVRAGGSHGRNAPVEPCFRTVSYARSTAHSPQSRIQVNPVNSTNTAAAQSAAGWGDSVTLEERGGQGQRTLLQVAWAGTLIGAQPTPPGGVGPSGQGWIAFDGPVGRDVRQNALPNDGREANGERSRYTRLLKFPSGELPRIIGTPRAVCGGDANGAYVAGGRLDEVRVTPFATGDADERLLVWDESDMDFTAAAPRVPLGVTATSDEIPVNLARWNVSNTEAIFGGPGQYTLPNGLRVDPTAALGLPQNDAGLVLIDDEVIAFRTVGTGRLLGCQRGFMGTIPTDHGYGAEVTFLGYVPVTILRGAMDAADNVLTVADSAGLDPQGGLLLIDSEAIHYTRTQQNQLLMPWALNLAGEAEGGLFRGRFGTSPAAHDGDAIVLALPLRYWDRYAERQDSSELSFYGFGLDRPGAFFHRIEFEEFRPDPSVDLEVLCRTRRDVPWAAEPGKTPGLFLFDDADAKSPARIDQTGDGLELRVRFRYLAGAFNPLTMDAHGWKLSPQLRSLHIVYYDETQVLDREASR